MSYLVLGGLGVFFLMWRFFTSTSKPAQWSSADIAAMLPSERVAEIERRWARSADQVRQWAAPAGESAYYHSLDPSLLLGIISVESAGNPDALGDGGHAHGLMQVHDRAWPREIAAWQANGATPKDNIAMGGDILAHYIHVMREHGLSGRDAVRAGVAAYNTGPANVKNSLAHNRAPGSTTSGRDYDLNVLYRAARFRESQNV